MEKDIKPRLDSIVSQQDLKETFHNYYDKGNVFGMALMNFDTDRLSKDGLELFDIIRLKQQKIQEMNEDLAECVMGLLD